MGKKTNKAAQKSAETLSFLERKLKIINEMTDKGKARILAERLYMNNKEKTNEM